MAESQHEAGIRITGDATGAVDATKQVSDEQKKLAEQTRRTNESSKAAAEESRRFVERLKEQAETVGKTRAEAERYRASQLSLTEAQRRSVDVSVRQIEAYDRKQQALRFVGRAAAAATVLILGYGAAVAASTKGTIDQAAALHNVSQTYGIATETLSAYQYQMKLAGVGQAEFSLGMKALAKNISEARGGSGDGATIFKLLGKDIESAVRSGASMQELLPLLADRFASFADGPNKAALAMATFGGRVGEQLIPELNKGAAGFRAAAREAAEFGRIIGQDTARQAEEFNTNLARTNALLTAQGHALAIDALPALNRYLEQLIQGTRIAGGFMAAIGRFGFMNPNPEAALASAESSLGSLREQRGRLTGRRASGPLAQSIDERIRAEEQRAQFARFLINQRLSEGGRDTSSPLFEFAGGGIGPPKAQAPGLPRAGGDGGRTAAQIMAELSGVNANFTEDLKTLHAEYAAGAMSLETYRTAVEQLIQAQRFAQDLAKQEAEGLEQATKTIDERRQAWIDEGVARANAEMALEAQVEQLELETSVMVLSNDERERALALHQLEQKALTLTAEKYEELRARVNAVYDRRVVIGDQDARIRTAIDAQQDLDAQAKRSAQAFETAVATGIMTGMRRGGGNLAQQLTRTFSDAIYTAMLTPVATAIARPFGQFGAALSGQGSFAWPAWASFGGPSSGQQARYEEDAAGNVTVIPASGGGGFASAAGYALPFIGAFTQYQQAGGSADPAGAKRNAGLAAAGAAIGSIWGPVGAGIGYMAGNLLGGLLGSDGPTTRTGVFGGPLGGAGLQRSNWFDYQTAGGVSTFAQALATQEQNLIRNLGISPEQVAGINARLPQREYGFGTEHTPFEQSGVLQAIAADRLQAISQVLGKSIEDLTRIMSLSAEQWESTVRVMRENLEAGERALAQHVRGLPGSLGITGLQGFIDSMATAEDQAPLARVDAGLSLYRRTRARALGGELGAVRELPGVAGDVLGIGREVYASGEGFQGLRSEIQLGLSEVLARQETLQLEIMQDVPLTIMQASQNEVDEIRKQTTALVTQLEALRRDFARLSK